MTSCCGNNVGGAFTQTCTVNSASGMPSFAFILVLFILLVICGTAYIF